MTQSVQRPPITLSSTDFERLDNLIAAIERSQPDVAAYLSEELDRAKVAPKEDLPEKLVVMGADVTFRDDMTGDVHHKQLVYPDQAHGEDDRLSILTPVGAALIGLSEGQSIDWHTRSGEERRLTILKVARLPVHTAS
ncbi:nucleoside diphosphate kinase regulator [Dongia soli]|uniref:Nucleoside diphosphate kinase regulator n=1 Tax=Dongia soli TaxID=600628 RepID=A0ABU5EHK3_9PROT|nr:nucleoside diphosphate kinase regulator [Dongia soli]MDY0885713.1 nucleoside diphosphate kinase regulator [Dongia soli]